MRIVQTFARGENSISIESFGLLESGSAQCHTGALHCHHLFVFFVLIADVMLPFQSTNAE